MTNEVREALREIESHAEDSGDGGWFETLVRTHGPAIRHWNVDAVHKRDKWPARTTVFPDSSPEDITIDLVAEDAAGKRLIAIQCKARREGSAITLEEVHDAHRIELKGRSMRRTHDAPGKRAKETT